MTPPRASAVLLPLYARGAEPLLLLIKRSERVAWHKGEIAFPGGRVEPSDGSALEAALRETEEELGIPAPDVAPVVALEPVSTVVSDMLIYPFVGVLSVLPALHPDPFEVAQVLEAPLRCLLDPASFREEVRVVRGVARLIPFYQYGEHKIWGATGRILHDFLTRIANADPSRDAARWTLAVIARALADADAPR